MISPVRYCDWESSPLSYLLNRKIDRGVMLVAGWLIVAYHEGGL